MPPGRALLSCDSPVVCVAWGTAYGCESVRAILDGTRDVLCMRTSNHTMNVETAYRGIVERLRTYAVLGGVVKPKLHACGCKSPLSGCRLNRSPGDKRKSPLKAGKDYFPSLDSSTMIINGRPKIHNKACSMTTPPFLLFACQGFEIVQNPAVRTVLPAGQPVFMQGDPAPGHCVG